MSLLDTLTPRALLGAACFLSVAAHADQAARLELTVGEGELITLSAPAATVFVADPKVADVQVAAPKSVFVFGVGSGRTSFYALDEEGRPLARRDVVVGQDLAMVRSVLAKRFPKLNLRLDPGPKSVMVSGVVQNPEQAEAVIATVAGAMAADDRVINQLRVADPVQVTLRVRIAEVSRSVDERLGVNWGALFSAGSTAFTVLTGSGVVPQPNASYPMAIPQNGYGAVGGRFRAGNFDIAGLLDAMNREGLARTLAEPNLTAVSGETASFLAGGEFPIPVSETDNKITVDYKQFGVMLDFTPTVLSRDRISLRVRPEVSDISERGAIRLTTVSIPAISVRRVDTTVELASGQSLVIGGLLQQITRDQLEKLPGLGDIPVLGSLFTSTKYLNNETELVVTVTPYVVRGVAPDALSSPISPRSTDGALEALLTGDVNTPLRLNGAAGFSYCRGSSCALC